MTEFTVETVWTAKDTVEGVPFWGILFRCALRNKAPGSICLGLLVVVFCMTGFLILKSSEKFRFPATWMLVWYTLGAMGLYGAGVQFQFTQNMNFGRGLEHLDAFTYGNPFRGQFYAKLV